MDYGKYKFEQEKKAREAKKKQHTADVKEVKMRYKIEEHDYQVRVSQAKRFLEAGDKVKATITFRGREIQHSDLAEDLLKKMAGDLQDFAELQQAPKKEGRNMMMLLSPKATTTTTVTPKATTTTTVTPKATTTTVIPKVTIAPVVKVSSD